MNVVVLDTECAMCSAFANWVIRHDSRREFRFASSNSDFWRTSPHRPQVNATRTVVLIEGYRSTGERVFTRSDAALRVVSRCRTWIAPLARLVLFLPSFLRDAVYDVVAARRRTLNLVCPLPVTAEPDRFLA